jgi:hypothetical protein
MYSPKADIKRKGGRGLLQIEATYKTNIIIIAEYLNTKYKEDQFVNIVESHKICHLNVTSAIKRQQRLWKK